ncbi:MAG TPA: hypothetical protein V6D05_12785 [Stenomitos sp.]
MSAPQDRERLTREMRTRVVSMFVVVTLYALFLAWFRPSAHVPLTVEAAFLALSLGLLTGGLYVWWKTPTPQIMELASRKLGKAEREPGLAPRAVALRSRLRTAGMLVEFAAFAGLVTITFKDLRLAGVIATVFSLLALGWLWRDMPRKIQEVLG